MRLRQVVLRRSDISASAMQVIGVATSSRVRVEGDDFGHGESDARKNMMGKAG